MTYSELVLKLAELKAKLPRTIGDKNGKIMLVVEQSEQWREYQEVREKIKNYVIFKKYDSFGP